MGADNLPLPLLPKSGVAAFDSDGTFFGRSGQSGFPKPLEEILAPMDEGDMAMEDAARGDDRLLKAAEVQRELGGSRATAYRTMTDGTLPNYRFRGGHGRPMVRVSRSELRAWLDVHRAAPPSAA